MYIRITPARHSLVVSRKKIIVETYYLKTMRELIFLSHTGADKPIVDTFASRLSDIFGTERIFYDRWSIAPGESIIRKMSDGIGDSGFFFLFISKASLNSKMVEREWQSSLYRAIRGELKFVPVMLENVPVPAIFGDINHLSVYSNGVETVLNQMVDIIRGQSKTPLQPLKNNLICHVKANGDSYDLAIEANMYTEPKSNYLLVTDCPIQNIIVKPQCSMYESTIITVKRNGVDIKAFWIMVEYATVPNFPFRINVSHKEKKQFVFSLYHQISEEDFEPITLTT